jgi:hypothetical protein
MSNTHFWFNLHSVTKGESIKLLLIEWILGLGLGAWGNSSQPPRWLHCLVELPGWSVEWARPSPAVRPWLSGVGLPVVGRISRHHPFCRHTHYYTYLVCKKRCFPHFVAQNGRPKWRRLWTALRSLSNSRTGPTLANHPFMPIWGSESMTKHRFLRIVKTLWYHVMWHSKMTKVIKID